MEEKKKTSLEVIDSCFNLNDRILNVAVPIMVLCIAGIFMGIGQQNIQILLIAIGVLLLNLLLLLNIECIGIDHDRKSIRKYKNYFLFKIGKSYPWSDFSFVVVLYSSGVGGGTIAGATTNWGGVTYRHYEVALIGEGRTRLFLKEFYQPGQAEKFQKMIGEKTGIKCADRVVPNMFSKG